jgi:hypothetical protein
MTSQLAGHETAGRLPAGIGRGPGGYQVKSPQHCPVPGCSERINPSRLMCRPHWYLVPKPVRDRVWASWRSGSGTGSPAHQHWVRMAIAAAAGTDQSPADNEA